MDVEQGESPDEITPIIQRSCSDKDLPAEVRLGFVKKVYGIVMYMLLVSAAVAMPFVLHPSETIHFVMIQHPWIMVSIMGLFLAQYLFNFCMMGAMCMGSPGLWNAYMRMFKTAPQNYLYLTVTAGCFGTLIGIICCQFKAYSVALVFALSLVLIVALTIYAVYTNADFTGMGMYVFVAIIGLALMGLVASFFPYGSVMHRVVGGIGATIFGFVIVYDTQMIFGSSSKYEKEFEYTIDMYAFAAYQLYLDFINFFIYLLQFLGDRR